MTILLIPSEEFQPPESHLAGIFQRHQCTALHKAGWNVSVLSVKLQFSTVMIVRTAIAKIVGGKSGKGLEQYRFSQLPSLLAKKLLKPSEYFSIETMDGYEVFRINGLYLRRPSPKKDHISWTRAGLIAFHEVLKHRGKPALIHAHNCNPAGILARQIQKKTGIPYIITEHSSYYHRKLIPQDLFPELRDAFINAASVAVVSPALGDCLKEELGLKSLNFHWIPNVIDPGLADNSSTEPCPREKFVFLSIGELIPIKGHIELVTAFARMFAGQKQIELRIAGDGILYNDIHNLITSLGISSQVKLLGRISREGIGKEIAFANCIVMASHYETFGVALIEALAHGRPVIATSCGGPNCIVNNSNGILVPPKNIEKLAIALQSMKSNYNRFDPLHIRKEALSQFGEEKLVQNLSVLYQDCNPQLAETKH
jgi:teichuronic acid biosynthesis glycosyltransferase TuaC